MSPIAFIESTIGMPLSDRVRDQIVRKQEFYNTHCAGVRTSAHFIGRQFAHLAMMPYKVVKLALQTITDIAMLAISLATTPISLLLRRTSIKEMEKEIACRCYNVLVADLFAWGCLVPSVISFRFYEQATVCHLGSFQFGF